MDNTMSKLANIEETSRPTLYRALKYWGKKPHNVWRNLIETNTDIGNIVYDPFAGSAITFFEAIKVGRKPIIADINPLTLFLVDFYSREYDIEKLKERFEEIKFSVQGTDIYKKNYIEKCSNCGNCIHIYNYRWNNNLQTGYSYKCPYCKKTITDNKEKMIYNENLHYWKPDKKISDYTSVGLSATKKFVDCSIRDVWSKRNLEILSMIFSLIVNSPKEIKSPLIFAFLQILHLTTKMCALRSQETNRPLSTSWGRPAYMFLKNRMEQNPLLQFERALNEKNGVIKSLISRRNYIPKYTYSTNLDDIDMVDGIVCLADSKKIRGAFKADLIITDPPYGSIIQYGELSQIWNVWLEKYDSKYKHDLKNEIIVNKTNKDYAYYTKCMSTVFSNCRNLLKQNGTLILTFNSNNDNDWKAINKAIVDSGLNIKYKYLQKNLRTSEANVRGSSEISKSDYYLIIKQ